ncbi:putative disease resistance protein At3g14460 isoform X1 [Quercus robur]|uniref:putative disease resistance protein At3g14460 isoform X1 n=1 Tax=Quercus robur TaxID=38942 RepID=UPI002163CBB8|nr:putative disease resistance protein At3g14460 isoform X1 [Quercus robur]XP_050283416.1 putative disease resistance protein At3g14460 isoform X1 [Quercus robur]XP_050283418.1 putative disease resistance protein At3g14460 isoform X1 [Quercus robur]XP_050283419.1 putative disease resistance protein At3g14460 isoform X1 [Quercus robur]XP_050283420.1 putative disease resistance protein At3g14460 isoform X1 [Quercus robur]XP_050283421.1 putative disease resistance protein At3g14460 isoform X1 [Qu
MALEFVGGAVFSAFLQVAFDRMASRDVVNFLKGSKVIEGLVRKLKLVLISADSLLVDAEEKQFEDPNVKRWLNELKDAAYVADDLLDEIATEALRSKSEAEFQTSTSTVWDFFSANSFDIQSKLEEILDNLEYIIKQKDALGLVANGALKDAPGLKGIQSRPLTTSCPEEYGVFGRDKDKEGIFEKFQSNGASVDGICVVPIVGMGGVGKTTLARFVFNDKRIEESFDLKAWVCVSENFDNFRIAKTIFEEVTSSACDNQNMNFLQNKIREKFMEKKVFLVLDDVWNEKYNDWVELLKVIRCGAKEIKIIVTTRSTKVASNVRTVAPFFLRQLSDEECWSLFKKHTFINGKASDPILEDIGRQIAQKCKGLPLAAKTLGGLLRCEQDPKEWTMILKSDIWNLPEEKSSILPALRLSYHYLPSHLKQCFAYCSILPKDYEFKKEELVLLWMAQDFLQQSKGNGRMEEIGERYFDDLVSRSLFQQSSTSESRFIMHDLVNDLATFISGEFCFRLEEDNELNEITEKTRHFSCYEGRFDDSKKFEILYDAKDLRTFLEKLKWSWRKEYDNLWKMKCDLLKEFKTMRVLTFSSSRITELPNFVDDLKHLRYLNISDTVIKHLPDSLCKLYNLQTLILSRYITKFPTNTSKLINLRHLDNSKATMEEMPPQMGKMKNLRKLYVFGVGKHDDGSSIKELGELQHLSGKLSLLNLENVQCINKDITEVILKNKQDLSKLKLEWKPGHGAEDSEKERILLEQLCPHTNLNSLTITNYEGTSFPKWLGDSSFSKMVYIELRNCDNCFSLPPLGQLPDLKSLKIQCFGGISSAGPEFYGNTIKPFRALECLTFEDMPEWQEWVIFEGEVFTCLRKLYIKHCPKLSGGLPVQLPSLTTLEIRKCEQLVASLPNSPALHALLCSGKIQVPNGDDYQSLKRVYIEGGVYSILPFLPEFASLSFLAFSECPDLVSFPSGGLCAPNLSRIVIQDCRNLKSLPEGMHTLLPSLVHLGLYGCQELESFPEGGLPSSLESLAINRCEKLISRRMELGLQGLHSLRSFKICGYDNELESFPEEALLPPNLTDFGISYLPNLKSLNGKGFQHLTSLKRLTILGCQNLDCLLEDVLPTSLCELYTFECRLLKERYGNEKGEGRAKIAHIPNISIDY